MQNPIIESEKLVIIKLRQTRKSLTHTQQVAKTRSEKRGRKKQPLLAASSEHAERRGRHLAESSQARLFFCRRWDHPIVMYVWDASYGTTEGMMRKHLGQQMVCLFSPHRLNPFSYCWVFVISFCFIVKVCW